MSLRLEMLQVARLAPKQLGESTELVRKFFQNHQNPDGGFRGRKPESDLYYTVFGLEGLLAFQVDFSPSVVQSYLAGFNRIENLDFVHLCCLARCHADVLTAHPGAHREFDKIRFQIAARLKQHRSQDGGFHPEFNAPFCSAYACLLAVTALLDCGAEIEETERIAKAIRRLETPDHGYSNDHCIKVGGTNTTAAAVYVMRLLNQPMDAATADWLLARAEPQGGFLAVPNAPIPDLLSSATALHALAAMQRDFSAVKEPCLDFLDSLWSNEGGFHGSWADDHLDCEYTYYGLLALGHLCGDAG